MSQSPLLSGSSFPDLSTHIYPTPNWEDFLRLSFDEIRHYGANSVQITRRLRSALVGIAQSISDPERTGDVERYVQQLNALISRLPLDAEDRAVASQEDRQGLGVRDVQGSGQARPRWKHHASAALSA